METKAATFVGLDCTPQEKRVGIAVCSHAVLTALLVFWFSTAKFGGPPGPTAGANAFGMLVSFWLVDLITALGVVVLTALSWKKSRLRVRVLGLMPPLLPLGALLWATLME